MLPSTNAINQSFRKEDAFTTGGPAFRVNEIFISINGEGPLTGEAAIFLRLSGCNLRCSYCDTQYARSMEQGMFLRIRDILAELKRFPGIRNVTLTGGEPLLARDVGLLITEIIRAGYHLNIETNGSIDLTPFMELDPERKIIFCCDYKLPCSGEESRMYLPNISMLRPGDALKFVIGESSDFEKISTILQGYRPRCLVYLSPVFGKTDPREIVEKLLSWSRTTDVSRIRIQLQLHKYIWEPCARGV